MRIILVVLLSLPWQVFACNFSKDIEKQGESYLYTKDCHVEVGRTVKKLELSEQESEELRKALMLKGEALRYSEQRTQLWMDTSLKLEDRVNQIDKYKESQKWLWFGLGVVLTGLAVKGAGELK